MDENQITDGVNATPPFPPPGFVDRHEAARMFGVAATTWGEWERRGRVGGGRIVPVPRTGTRIKLYAVDELRRQLEEFKKGPLFPPAGFVDRHEAAWILGISSRTLSTWESLGRVSCGQVVPVPGKPGTAKIYPIEALRRLAGEFQATRELKASEPFPPPGFVTRQQTCGIIGIKIKTLCTWESEGRFKHGIWSQVPGKPGRCRLYPIDEINWVAEEYKRSKEIPQPYPDPDRPNVIRVPVTSSKHQGMEAIIDAADLPLVQGKRWWWTPGRRDGDGSVMLGIVGQSRPLHQIIMGVHGIQYRVGHLNGDPLDCRRENLVVRTASEQKAATRKVMIKAGREMSSRFKGVSRKSAGERWMAVIVAYGQRRLLGRFRSEIGAALAYDEAAREIFGQHACVNFSDADEIARMRAMALEEQNAVPPPFPPPGFIDRRGACRMFSVNPGRGSIGRNWGGLRAASGCHGRSANRADAKFIRPMSSIGCSKS